GVNPAADLASILELYRHIRDVRPDRVFAYTIKPVIYGVAAAHWARVPQIYAMITGLGYVFTGRTVKQRLLFSLIRRFYSFSLRRTDAVFFQNPDDCRLFDEIKLLNKKVRSVLINGSGVDTDRFRLAPLPK